MAEQKSAYEIRLEILKLTKDFVENQFYLQKELAMTQWEQSVEFAKKSNESIAPSIPSLSIPTLETWMAMAEKMNVFVSQKTPTFDVPGATVDEIKSYFNQIQNLLVPSKKPTK